MRYSIIFYITAFVSFFSLGCDKDNFDDNPTVWSKKLDNDIPLFNYDPIIYNDLVIQKIVGRGRIVAFDKTTGEEKWTWKNALDDYGVDGFSVGHYLFENILVVGWVNLTYGINMNTGQTLWENKATTNAVPFIKGLDEKIVKYDYNPDVEYFIRLGNVTSGDFETIHHWQREDEYFIGNTLPLIFEWQGIEYIVWSQIKWGSPSGVYESHQFLHLYNLDDRKLEWVSDTIPLQYSASGTAGLRPKFHDGQILLDNDAIYSYNVEDGSLEWWKYYGNGFTTSRLTCAEGKVFANNDDDYMIALDVHTGSEYWRTTTANGMSHIKYHDGKLYIAGGLDNEVKRNLFIIDSQTGEKLVSHRLPGTELVGSFDNIIAVDPETGWVYAGDHEHLLCFDFGLE